MDGSLQLTVEDEGPGLPDTANLFVPFFTTKPAGSGIGLALSRQIAEAHGGTLALENRTEPKGAARSCGCRSEERRQTLQRPTVTQTCHAKCRRALLPDVP